MTQNDDDMTAGRKAAQRRISEISVLFEDIRELMVDLRAQAAAECSPKNALLLQKISEIQKAHGLVLRAEEEFHDRFGNGRADEGIDYDAIRRDIGGALDRIRVAAKASFLSEDPDA